MNIHVLLLSLRQFHTQKPGAVPLTRPDHPPAPSSAWAPNSLAGRSGPAFHTGSASCRVSEGPTWLSRTKMPNVEILQDLNENLDDPRECIIDEMYHVCLSNV